MRKIGFLFLGCASLALTPLNLAAAQTCDGSEEACDQRSDKPFDWTEAPQPWGPKRPWGASKEPTSP